MIELTEKLYNIALGASTTQKSQSSSQAAVDGTVWPSFGGGSCSVTDTDPESWWAADLGLKREVYAVSIVNRIDCCGVSQFLTT